MQKSIPVSTVLNNLVALGWSQARLCRELGIHPVTASKWSKRGCAPLYALAYTNLALKVKKAAEGL